LFKTGSFPNPDLWNGDFNSLSPSLIDWLAARGVKLVGIDTPSVDPADDQELASHQAIFRNDLAILEGIWLEGVAAGQYTLVAPPLKLEGADASPVRALLLPKGSFNEGTWNG
jgi:arylformamidase